MQGMPIDSMDFSCMRRMMRYHVWGVCATLAGTLSIEPTLYLPITVSSIASSSWNPSALTIDIMRM